MIKKNGTKTDQRLCSQMLVELRELAGDRVKWRDVVANVSQL